MWRKFCTREFAIARIAALRCVVTPIAFAVLWIGAVDLGARDGSKDWVVLENCQLVPNAANDGDSFHVNANGKQYMFRLYFVDAPETDAGIGESAPRPSRDRRIRRSPAFTDARRSAATLVLRLAGPW